MMADILQTEAAIADVLQNRCSQIFRKFHRKAPVLESLFDKVATFKAYNFIKKRLQHNFLWNLRNFEVHIFLQDNSGGRISTQ